MEKIGVNLGKIQIICGSKGFADGSNDILTLS